jgi:hypothetical protein
MKSRRLRPAGAADPLTIPKSNAEIGIGVGGRGKITCVEAQDLQPVDAAGPESPGEAPAGAARRESPGEAVADAVLHHLDPRVIPMDRIAGWIFTACVSLGSLVAVVITWLAGAERAVVLLLMFLWVLVTAGFGWLAQYWPEIEHRYTFYKIDARALEIRRGVLFRRVITVPRSRVQHIDVSQGPLERAYGLASLSVYTAGTEHSEVSLKGLAHEIAMAVRDHLLPGLEDDGV